ncbi:MAG: type II secretion system F family protein [Candidatus Hydrogenedentes bacterium]|nr:type II secretion system F family protein [Candidatus Hydrogenedentota bacterium]
MGLLSAQIATKKLVPLCRQMASAYDAGIPIIRTLEMVREGVKDRQLRDTLTHIGDDLRRGSTLGEAVRNQSKYLSPVLIELLASGEAGGKLDVMLRDLADYYEDRLEMRRRIVGMSIYPGLQLVAAWFLGTFALRILGRVSGIMSGSTDSFNLTAFFRDYVMFQAAAMTAFAIVAAACILLARAGLFQWISGFVTTFIWPLGPVVRKFALARFFRSMSLMVGSGMHIQHCIERAAAVAANPYIERDLLSAIPKVRRGATLTEAFAGSRYFSPVAREMLMVGEQTGKLEESLYKASQYQYEEAAHAVHILTRVGGVAIVLAVAGLIGYIVISFYANLYGGIMNELGV